MYRMVVKWVVLIGVRTEGVGISLSITLGNTWFESLWNNWLIPGLVMIPVPYLPNASDYPLPKHKEANNQAKYFGIEEFGSPLMNTKTHLWKKGLRTPTTSFKNRLCGCSAQAPLNGYQGEQCLLIVHLLNFLNVCSPWVFVNVWFYPKGFKIRDALHDYKPNFCTA